ncbi:MAG: hypothetical protein PF961_22110 [Planctomycetota bacterium]|jgi:tetratricopeptide (TPR) repeat protein|nr:hypothetical protein [Planctomycetota bacterium]
MKRTAFAILTAILMSQHCTAATHDNETLTQAAQLAKVQAAHFVASRYSDARDYESAIRELQSTLLTDPDNVLTHSNLSVFYGKLGHYNMAKMHALQVLELNPPDTMHANMILASWEYHLGNENRAQEIMNNVIVPDKNDPRYRFYQSCRACYYASTGDIAEVEQAIQESLGASNQSMKFYRNDVIFDPYRQQQWFIDLVGITTEQQEPDSGD